MKNPITQEKFLEILDSLYATALSGAESKNFDSAEILARKYTQKTKDKHEAAKKIARNELMKTSSSGFLASLGGLITIPLTVPADMYVTFLVQIRMILAIAYAGGVNLHDAELKTVVFALLLGTEVEDTFIKVGLKPVGKKVTYNLLKKVPGKLLVAVNRKIGIRLFTVFGSKGFISLGLGVPLVGGLIGGGINYYFTRRISIQSIDIFVTNEPPEHLSKNPPE